MFYSLLGFVYNIFISTRTKLCICTVDYASHKCSPPISLNCQKSLVFDFIGILVTLVAALYWSTYRKTSQFILESAVTFGKLLNVSTCCLQRYHCQFLVKHFIQHLSRICAGGSWYLGQVFFSNLFVATSLHQVSSKQ